jgi:hypothetical protein
VVVVVVVVVEGIGGREDYVLNITIAVAIDAVRRAPGLVPC